MSSGYDYALSGEAVRTLLGSQKRLRQRAEQIIDSLVGDPFREPDFIEVSRSGRRFSVFVENDTVITLWVDHAVKELRIVRVEFV